MSEKTELRDAIFSLLDMYVESKTDEPASSELPWINGGADLAFADAALATGRWAQSRDAKEKVHAAIRFLERPKEDQETQLIFTMRLVRASAIREILEFL